MQGPKVVPLCVGAAFIGAALSERLFGTDERPPSFQEAARYPVGRSPGAVPSAFLSVTRETPLFIRRKLQALENAADRVKQDNVGLGPMNGLRIESDQAARDFHRFKSPPRVPVARLAPDEAG